MDLSLATTALLSAPVLAFLLGAVAVAIRSDLAVPDPVMTGLSYYLLLGIGIKGGVALRSSDPGELWLPLAVGLGLGALIPVAAFWLLRLITPYDPLDRGAIAAHYGSTSLVTFTATIVALDALAIAVPGYAATLLTALEIPGILVGLLLARTGGGNRTSGWGSTVRELLTGSSIVLLAGGLGVGAVLGESGYAPISPLFTDAFRGALVLFLLGLGVQAARRVGALRTGGAGLLVFAVVFPLAVVSAVTALAALIGLGIGGAVVLGVLCASASYIAAPAAVRVALPEANLALPLTASLSVTFPVNLFASIPLSILIATALA